MTKQSTALNIAEDVKNAADEAAEVVTEVSTEAKTMVSDAREDVAERTVAGLKEATAKVVSMTADTQKSLGENIEKVSQRMHELSAFNQQNLDAFARSSEITAKALESIGGEVSAYAKKSYADQVAAAQDISAARTLPELVEKQTAFAQHAFQGWAQQAIRISAIFTSAAKDIATPLGERISLATQEIKSIAR